MMAPPDAEIRPLEIDVQRDRQLAIRWSDGHVSVYPLASLRGACPCATCRAEREQPRPRGALRVLPAAFDAVGATIVETAELVGAYGVRLRWKDGHDTGIFDYRLLRSLCPCELCRGRGGNR